MSPYTQWDKFARIRARTRSSMHARERAYNPFFAFGYDMHFKSSFNVRRRSKNEWKEKREYKSHLNNTRKWNVQIYILSIWSIHFKSPQFSSYLLFRARVFFYSPIASIFEPDSETNVQQNDCEKSWTFSVSAPHTEKFAKSPFLVFSAIVLPSFRINCLLSFNWKLHCCLPLAHRRFKFLRVSTSVYANLKNPFEWCAAHNEKFAFFKYIYTRHETLTQIQIIFYFSAFFLFASYCSAWIFFGFVRRK